MSLSLKATQADPWKEFERTSKAGSIITGTVTNVETLTGGTSTQAFRRRIPTELVFRAMAVVAIMLFYGGSRPPASLVTFITSTTAPPPRR